MAFTLDPQTEKITFGVVSDGTHDAVAIALADQIGVSEDFLDQFTADNWSDIGSGFGVNTISEVLEGTGLKDGVINSTQFDLGSGFVSDTNWTLRFKLQLTGSPTITTSDSVIYIGLDSIDQSTAENAGSHDSITLQLGKSSSTQNIRLSPFYSDGGVITQNSGGTLSSNTTDTIWYAEIIRTSSTSVTWNIYSDEDYTSLLFTATSTIPSTLTSLRYLIVRSRADASGGSGNITAEVDDLQFWDSTSVPIISSDNWRIRYKLDITNLDDGANATPKKLYMGMFNENNLSDADNSQDGFLLLLTHDNTTSSFIVRTPDAQTPNLAGDDATFTATPSVTTRYIEIKKDSSSQGTVSIYSDASFTTLVESEVTNSLSGSDDLRYLKFMNDVGSNASGAIDGSIDDITFEDLDVGTSEQITIDALLVATTDKTFTVDSILVNRINEDFTSDAIIKIIQDFNYTIDGLLMISPTIMSAIDSFLQGTFDETFETDAIIVARSCSPWKHFDDHDGSTNIMSISSQRDVVIEIPKVTVPTYVKSIKARVSSTSTQGNVRAFITTFPVPTTGNATMPALGTSDTLLLSSISSSLVTHTFTFSDPILLTPGVRYGIGWQDGIGNAPGFTYGTIEDTTLDFTELTPSITSEWREDAIGTPERFMIRRGQIKTWAVDVEITNPENGIICFYVDAKLIGREDVVPDFTLDWQYRENRISDNLNKKPAYTLVDNTDLELDSNGSTGVGYLFKTFKKSDITGSSISVTVGSVSGTVTLLIQDGAYDRRNEEDFPLGNDVPVAKGAGQLGILGLSAGSNTLSAGSINYAGSTEDEITVFIRARSTASISITDLQIGGSALYDFQNSIITLEQSGSTDVMDYGYFYTSGTSVPFVEFTFTVDASLTPGIGAFRDIGDLIIRVLTENPPSLTGLEIIEKIRDITEVELQWGFFGKTSRIKNWLGFLERQGIIEEDGSDPDWYETNWNLV